MQLPNTKHYATVAEYIKYENAALNKHEYREGEVVAMAGGSPSHSRIFMNLARLMGNALLGKPCGPWDSNVRIGIPRSTRYTYPDLSVVCGPPIYDPADPAQHTITNPRVIVEILSPSTEAYDRGEKFNWYQTIETLEVYILVSQETARVEIYHRQTDNAWRFTTTSGVEASTRIPVLEIDLQLAEIYAGVEFPPPPPEPVE